jgi:flagellar biosynthesis protein FlhB
MSSDYRPIPPGPGRTAAAARASLFPRSDAIPGGLALLASAGFGWLLSDPLASAIRALLASELASAASQGADVRSSISRTAEALGSTLLPVLSVLFLAALLGAALPVLMARKGRGHTASSLPRPPTGRLPVFVIRLLGAGLFLLIALHLVDRAGAMPTDAAGMLKAILTFACGMAGALGGVMLLVGITELTLMRHLIYRALHLDAAQARRELRGSEGDPRIKRQWLMRFRSGAGQ